MASWALAAGLAAGLTGCARSRLAPMPVEAQAFSLLGDTLWSLPVDPREGPRVVAQLQQARTQAYLEPTSLASRMQLARHTAAVGRLREAVELYGQAYILDPGDPRPSLRRGELYLILREFNLAVRDLRWAAARARVHNMVELQEVSGEVSTLPVRYSAAFHLGLAHYFRGDYALARTAFTEATEHAVTPDQVAGTALWLYFVARRLADLDEAMAILTLIPADFEVVARVPELQLLLAFKGEYPVDSLLRQLTVPEHPDVAAYAYGIGFALDMQGDEENATMVFRHALRGRDWANPFYIACEVELARRR